MKYTLISYKDKETETFSVPIPIPQDVESCREMIREGAIKGKIEDAANKIAFALGEFDSVTGEFVILREKLLLMDLSSFVQKQPKDA